MRVKDEHQIARPLTTGERRFGFADDQLTGRLSMQRRQSDERAGIISTGQRRGQIAPSQFPVRVLLDVLWFKPLRAEVAAVCDADSQLVQRAMRSRRGADGFEQFLSDPPTACHDIVSAQDLLRTAAKDDGETAAAAIQIIEHLGVGLRNEGLDLPCGEPRPVKGQAKCGAPRELYIFMLPIAAGAVAGIVHNETAGASVKPCTEARIAAPHLAHVELAAVAVASGQCAALHTAAPRSGGSAEPVEEEILKLIVPRACEVHDREVRSIHQVQVDRPTAALRFEGLAATTAVKVRVEAVLQPLGHAFAVVELKVPTYLIENVVRDGGWNAFLRGHDVSVSWSRRTLLP